MTTFLTKVMTWFGKPPQTKDASEAPAARPAAAVSPEAPPTDRV